jgi:DNA polymerase-3 subunit delta
MYKRDLDALIAKGTLPKALLLYGESFFSDYYARKILPMWGTQDNILSFYFDEYHFESAKGYIAQPSLFGDVNVLYIRSDRKIPKKEIDALVAMCQKNPTSYFLLHFSGDDRAGKELQKSFTKKRGGDFARFFKPNAGEAIALLRERAAALGMQIENYTLQHLFMLQNEDLSLCMRELEKLSLLKKPITVSDIDTHVYGMGALSMDTFIVKVLQKEDIRDDLQRLLESGQGDEIRIVNAVSNFISQLLLFHIYIKVHGRYDVVEILGYPLPPQLVKERAALSIKYKLSTYKKLMTHLMNTEHALKYAQYIDKESYLISSLIKLQTFL